ncbi:unnamed protein product [Caenorhabditis angaria]|uniref:Protein-tyrosine-phosphatase n=1 Tax=Caenorhabditis angaria TaxID=860376 RepID=A0A9P1IG38_9PELO|nr:unnamed protein product [Caenorhabditis angaria]
MYTCFITIITLFVVIYQLIIGCSDKKKSPKIAAPIASPATKPSRAAKTSRATKPSRAAKPSRSAKPSRAAIPSPPTESSKSISITKVKVKSKKEMQEETPPTLSDDSSKKVEPYKIPYDTLIPWLVFTMRDGVANQLTLYDNKPDYVKRRRWFLAFDKHPELNRYKEPKCYDFTKVKFFLSENKKQYINASHVTSVCERRNYQWNILTQGPLLNTIPHFWEMVCNSDVEFIIMLCSFTEKGVEQSARYFPEKEGDVEKYGEFEVKYLKKEDDPVKNVIWTKLEVKNSDFYARTVNHIQVTWWPDKTAPEDPKPTIELYKWLEKTRDLTRKMVVHCDSGVGRSACFLGIDVLLKYPMTSENSNTRINEAIRVSRNGAIDSPLLQMFLLACLIEYCYQEKKFGPELEASYKGFMEEYKNYSKKMNEAANLKTQSEPPKKI